ncbi:MAG: TetR family transcriptional regulator [Micromonosporaceae bacterium]|nr:TetR family transcriptional regulator [Micromonosporaceae bacterium]
MRSSEGGSSGAGGGRTFTERARRAQIVGCAIELVNEVGFGQASVARIAQRAGVAKSVVLYHFANKEELVRAIVGDIFVTGATVMLPAMAAEETAAGKLAAYIRSNLAFINSHRPESFAILDIMTSFRTQEGLRLDEAASREARPTAEMANLDPVGIFELGQRTGEFRPLPAPMLAIALRTAIDGAVWQLSRDPDFDALAYGEELVTIFDLASRRQEP